MFVIDNTIKVVGLDELFEKLGETSAKAGGNCL